MEAKEIKFGTLVSINYGSYPDFGIVGTHKEHEKYSTIPLIHPDMPCAVTKTDISAYDIDPIFLGNRFVRLKLSHLEVVTKCVACNTAKVRLEESTFPAVDGLCWSCLRGKNEK